MQQTLGFIVTFLAAGTLFTLGSPARNSTVILVIFDGFRWDYMSKADTPNLDFIARTGVSAPFVKNVFPTVTLPNVHTIVTGLFPESHGLVANEIFDPQLGAMFDIGNNESRWWNDAEPIWVTNQKHGFKSGTCFYPGFDVTIKGYFPSYSSNGTGYSKPFISGGKVMPSRERIDMLIKWLTADEPPTFVAIYFEEPDLSGHEHGPDSPQVQAAITNLDHSITGYLLDKLREVKLLDQVNLVFTSDHGMTTYNTSIFVNFDAIVDPSTYQLWGGNRAFFTIQPNEGNQSYVYHRLNAHQSTQRFSVYKKENVPENLHYRQNRRIGSIVAIMKEGWYARSSKVTDPAQNGSLRGEHGYSTTFKDMYPFFVARGPAFKEDFVSDPFNLTDIYPLLCHVLGIEPAPNNGSLNNVKLLLRDLPVEEKRPHNNYLQIIWIAVLGFVALVCIVSMILLTISHCKRRERKNAWLAREETEGLATPEQAEP